MIIIGDNDTGKSSLINQYMSNKKKKKKFKKKNFKKKKKIRYNQFVTMPSGEADSYRKVIEFHGIKMQSDFLDSSSSLDYMFTLF